MKGYQWYERKGTAAAACSTDLSLSAMTFGQREEEKAKKGHGDLGNTPRVASSRKQLNMTRRW
jgi:hypothetical protein